MTEKERKIEKEKDQVHDKNVDDRPRTTYQTCRSSLFLTVILIMNDLFRKRTKKEARREGGVRRRELLQSKPVKAHHGPFHGTDFFMPTVEVILIQTYK